MACPFLREVQVKYCRAATVRKLIPLVQGAAAETRCASPDHVLCKAFQAESAGRPLGPAAGGACPYLSESLMQYCGAAPVTKFVPYSESSLSRCGRDNFRYCDLYQAMAHPEAAETAEGIAVLDGLRYSANHMWLDVADDHVCHAGIDAFFARALGQIDGLAYVWQAGRHRPAAVLTVAGMDLEVVFPNPLLLTGCNLHLRANPSRMVTDPYTAGWLFEGTALPETVAGLREGAEAHAWMEREQGRMNEHLQKETCPRQACDGGLFAAGLPRRLDRPQWFGCFHEFFAPDFQGREDG
jgi:glycine cleavage system H lipoate-binding protein